MTEIRFMLPMPPSVNALYATNWKTHRRFESKRYEQWKVDALHSVLSNLPRPKRTAGQVALAYLFGRPDRRRRDVENYSKAVSDFITAQAIIDDDSCIARMILEWVDDCPGQVEVIIEPYTKRTCPISQLL